MQISYDGQSILLTIPSPREARSHTIKIPLERCGVETNSFGNPLPSQRGWAALLDILKEQYSTSHSSALIGTKASPVQYDLEAMLKCVKIVGKKRQAKPEMTLEDLDL